MRNQTYPTLKQYQEALALIQDSIEGERADAMFYDWLIDNIPERNLSPSDVKNIEDTIQSIRTDELGHNVTYKNMYRQLTQKEAEVKEEEFVPPANFMEGISKALYGELNAVKKYRTIMAGLPGNYYRDQVFNILTDELRHGNLYNYIYSTVLNDRNNYRY